MKVSFGVPIEVVEHPLQRHDLRVQLVQLRVGDLGGGALRHLAFQCGSDIDQVIEDRQRVVTADNCLQHQGVKQVPIFGRQDLRPLPLFDYKEALFFQELERLPDDGAAHAVVLAQNGFRW